MKTAALERSMSFSRADRRASTQVDASGSPLFSAGTLGALHVFVHRCLDADEPTRAAPTLRRFLRDHPARDAATVHLHWHLLVLDVGLGSWDAAYGRFSQHVLPWIAPGHARTDGPSALWHLALACGDPNRLPWAPAARLARVHLNERDPFLALHDALALAGAGAVAALDEWLERRASDEGSPLLRFGRGLRAHVSGDHAQAARLLRSAQHGLAELGGSRAQHGLFELIGSKYGLLLSRSAA